MPSTLQKILSTKMLVATCMGFASGLPLLLTKSTLQAWMTDAGVHLTVIGLFALVAIPYSFKFAWAPVFDRYVPPFLGRRRGWMLLTQVGLILCIAGLACTSPHDNAWLVALLAVLVAFCSASQDILVDAYRRESLSDDELGLGSSLYVLGYRVAMLVSGGLALYLADHVSWQAVYLLMAGLVSVGILTTVLCPEPAIDVMPPMNIWQAFLRPLVAFLQRDRALLILLFILFYKLGDTMAGGLTTNFYMGIGYSKTEIAAIAKTFGIFSAIAGGLTGGVIMLRIGLHRALWIFGVLQAVVILLFAALANLPHNNVFLATVIFSEDFAMGMATTAFTAYIASQTDKSHTATQYALLTSLMVVPRTIISAPMGIVAAHLGWTQYFIFCTLCAIPGMVLLALVAPWKAVRQEENM
jgi:MFS transporter, PAT family, beta-lactamase induction signal transducer AmpG